MRILYCNKYNYPFSGTEVYLLEVMDLMRDQGHEVALFSMADERSKPTPYDRHLARRIDFKEKAGWWQKAQDAGHMIYSTDSRSRIRGMIADFRPDVAHVRNIYHHLSPSILWELKKRHVPVMYHINDFKLLCPAYNLVLQGKPCEACKGGRFWNALSHPCYPGIVGRAMLTTEAYVHRWLGTFKKCIDLFLAPTQFVRDKFVEHGWDNDKFDVLPHFQRAHELGEQDPAGNRPLLYFGRLSAEKGIDDLLRAMQKLPHLRLVVAGEGPQRSELQTLADSLRLSNVKFVRQVASAERDSLIAQSRFTVLPSHAYETLGKTILESYAEGRAVVATDFGSRRELVTHGVTGYLYPPGDVDQLAAAIQLLASTPQLAEQMGRAGWEMVRERYTPAAHFQKLLSLYQGLAELQKRRNQIASVPLRRIAGNWRHNVVTNRQNAAEISRPSLRIAFIGGRGVVSKYSGIETYYEEVGKRLAEMGHEVTIYCRNYFTPDEAAYNGMRLVRLPTIRSKHLETLIHTLLSTGHALIQRYDVVHYHALGPALFSFLPRLIGKKTVVTVQGLDWQRKKWGRFASAILWLGERASAYFPSSTMVVSKVLQQRYRELHRINGVYIPNGGVLRTRSKPDIILDWGLEPNNYVLFLGRFSPEKGCHLLVEAFEQIETNAKLVMAGASSYCDDYSRRLRSHASERIRILDWVSGNTLNELLTNAMIFVLPSDLEGLSLALLDAMGAGLCALTSDVPENREVVDGAGLTFRQGNVKDISEQLRFLIENPAVREAAGRAARRRVEEQYQWQKVTQNIEKSYFELMGWRWVANPAKRPNGSDVSEGVTAVRQERVG
ncbi:MAG TPA: glycosyltransferase family 4 protein [Candidatus Sulfotelmatobacter sp.]|nr:glycosyltransferase family 4 protein [Candidatus Sulfotelmatobacter sp.]